MKHSNDTIKQQVEKTLDLLDNADRVAAGPWFHTRLRQKIDALGRQRTRQAPWMGFGLLRPALLLLVIGLNLATAFMTFRQTDQGSTWTTDRQEALSAFAKEYQFTGDSDLLDAYSITEE